MNTISRHIKSLIQKNGSKFMTISFIKKDGSERTMQARYYKHPAHTGNNPVAHIDKYVTVIVGHAGGVPIFRNVNCETITRIAASGKVIFIK